MSLLRAHWLPIVRCIVDFSLIAIQCCPLTFGDEAAAKGELLLTTVSAKYFMKVIEHNPYKFAITL